MYDGRSRSYRPGRSAEEYDRLYAELQPLVRRLLSQYGVGDEGRRDLAVEIYYRYRQLVNAYDPDRGIPLRPYLVKGLTFSVYTHVRKQWRTARVEMRLSTAMELQPGAFAVDDTEALQPILSRDLRRMLLEAIRRLPERQRRTVLYRYYHSLSFEEIGERLQVRPATARSNLRHALETLRQELRGKLPLGE
ncbi:MAG: RNA polymerase sigma factor [Armatimonadota bacterium]